jgi:hypothetical protein
MSDPDKPKISSTLWRTLIDHDAKRYYFDSVINPSVIWVNLDKVDLKPGAKADETQARGSREPGRLSLLEVRTGLRTKDGRSAGRRYNRCWRAWIVTRDSDGRRSMSKLGRTELHREINLSVRT